MIRKSEVRAVVASTMAANPAATSCQNGGMNQSRCDTLRNRIDSSLHNYACQLELAGALLSLRADFLLPDAYRDHPGRLYPGNCERNYYPLAHSYSLGLCTRFGFLRR